MSATNLGDKQVRARDALDFYPTPAWCVRAIDRIVCPQPSLATTLDPCAGDGAIIEALMGQAVGLEIDDRGAAAARARNMFVETRDALTGAPWPRCNFVIMNPPYKLAVAFVERALREVQPGGLVAALLRLNWLGSAGRVPFHRTYPSDVYVLTPRPSFTGGGSDSIEYAWFVWGPDRGNRWSILEGEGGRKSAKG